MSRRRVILSLTLLVVAVLIVVSYIRFGASYVDSLLEQYSSEEKVRGFSIYNELLKRGIPETELPPSLAAISSELNIADGNYGRALRFANMARNGAPTSDVPHILYAQIYYVLYIYDAMKRNLCNIATVPVEQLPRDFQESYLVIDINEMVAPGRPAFYHDKLGQRGFAASELHRVFGFMVRSRARHATPETQEALRNSAGAADVPKVVPIPDCRSDGRTAKLLASVVREIEASQGAFPMVLPSGEAGVLDPHIVASIYERARRLQGGH